MGRSRCDSKVEEGMNSPAAKNGSASTVKRSEPNNWKRALSELLVEMQIMPDKFSGKIVVSFKDGGVSYLEKTETFK
jgi:hypothetical protein